MASVLGTGPVAITTAKKAQHLTISLGALTSDGSSIGLAGWPRTGSPEDTPDVKNAAIAWANYLLAQGTLRTDTSPPGPAFLVAAVHPGTNGNTITLVLSNVTKSPSATTLDIAVTVRDTYAGLSLATIADTIGTAVDGGSKPGLIHLASVPPLAKMPDDAKIASFNPAGTVVQADVKGDGGTAFLLEAPGDGGGASQFDQLRPHRYLEKDRTPPHLPTCWPSRRRPEASAIPPRARSHCSTALIPSTL